MYARRPLSPSHPSFGYNLPPRTPWGWPSRPSLHWRGVERYSIPEVPPSRYQHPQHNTNIIPFRPPRALSPPRIEVPFPRSPVELDATTPFHTPATSPPSRPPSLQTNSTRDTPGFWLPPVSSFYPQTSHPPLPSHLFTPDRTSTTDTTQLITELKNTLQILQGQQDQTASLYRALQSQIQHLTHLFPSTTHAHSNGNGNETTNPHPTPSDLFRKQITTQYPYLEPYLSILDSDTDPYTLAAPPKGQKRCKLGQPQSTAKCPLRERDGDDLQQEICSKHTKEGFVQQEEWSRRYRRGQFRAWECEKGKVEGEEKKQEEKGAEEKRKGQKGQGQR